MDPCGGELHPPQVAAMTLGLDECRLCSSWSETFKGRYIQGCRGRLRPAAGIVAVSLFQPSVHGAREPVSQG